MTDKIPWIQTFTGRKFLLISPDPDHIDIVDIAHALSMLCRFNCHCNKFYSVAEHSVHISHEIDQKYALAGLLHDAAEAYLGDVPTPLKKELTTFKDYELQMEKEIGERFGVDPELFKSVELKRADTQLLMDEKAVIMGPEPEPWPDTEIKANRTDRIKCWLPEMAKAEFLSRFEELWDQKAR
jgi:5'-nucleotidase